MIETLPQTRRQLLRASACGGLSLSGLWSAQSALAETNKAATAPKIKACIVVFYYGGPSHLDTYDLKPNAPADVRGEFQPIASSAPGVMVSEHLPQMAKVMHKVAIVRSVNHQNRLHDSASTEMLTGRQSPQGDREEFAPIPQFYPCVGATCSYLWRERGLDVPHAALPFLFHNVVDVPCQGGGFLGSAFDPLQIAVDVEKRAYRAGSLAPAGWPDVCECGGSATVAQCARKSVEREQLGRAAMASVLRQGVFVARFRDSAARGSICRPNRRRLATVTGSSRPRR